MKRISVSWIAGAVLGAGLAFIYQAIADQNTIDAIIPVRWEAVGIAQHCYGAEVHLEEVDSAYTVKARVHIGRGNDYIHDIGEIGRQHPGRSNHPLWRDRVGCGWARHWFWRIGISPAAQCFEEPPVTCKH